MSRYLLKDSHSKCLFVEWLNSMAANYAIDAMLKWADEDALCEHFFSCIRGALKTPAGVLTVKSYKTRGRGPGAAEKKLGADGICIVDITTPNTNLKGFFLFQAKKAKLLTDKLSGAQVECSKMLSHTAASYLLTLMPDEAKMVGAMAVHSCTRGDPALKEVPYVSFARFAGEHLLQGIMLEPMHRLRDLLSPDLRAEINIVIGILGRERDQTSTALNSLQRDIQELGLDAESTG